MSPIPHTHSLSVSVVAVRVKESRCGPPGPDHFVLGEEDDVRVARLQLGRVARVSVPPKIDAVDHGQDRIEPKPLGLQRPDAPGHRACRGAQPTSGMAGADRVAGRRAPTRKGRATRLDKDAVRLVRVYGRATHMRRRCERAGGVCVCV
jgi:hypothetical protein